MSALREAAARNPLRITSCGCRSSPGVCRETPAWLGNLSAQGRPCGAIVSNLREPGGPAGRLPVMTKTPLFRACQKCMHDDFMTPVHKHGGRQKRPDFLGFLRCGFGAFFRLVKKMRFFEKWPLTPERSPPYKPQHRERGAAGDSDLRSCVLSEA